MVEYGITDRERKKKSIQYADGVFINTLRISFTSLIVERERVSESETKLVENMIIIFNKYDYDKLV